MRNAWLGAICAALTMVPQQAVAQTLTRDTAASLVRSALGPVAVPVTVEGISQANAQSPEAVVLATLDGREVRLHFRRYDSGWRWETTETDSGSQVAARVTVAALGERNRQGHASAWAKQQYAKYADTAETFWWVTVWLPRRLTDELDDSLVQERYAQGFKGIEISNRTDDEKARLLKKLNPVPLDVWGHKLLTVADPDKRTFLISSVGPDGKVGTPDDFTCLFVGYKHFDSERSEVVWDYRPNCVMPEGVTGVVSKVGGVGAPVVKTTQVVK